MRRITLSLAMFVLICFFLPWVQLGCSGSRESLSGLDLARRGDDLLWLIPLLMLLLIVIWLLRSAFEKAPALIAFVTIVSAGISGYLMYISPATIPPQTGLDGSHWTVFHGLGFAACICLGLSAIWAYQKKVRPP